MPKTVRLKKKSKIQIYVVNKKHMLNMRANKDLRRILSIKTLTEKS